MRRKVLAAALSLSMILGMGISASATTVDAVDESGLYGASIDVETGIEVPTISITVPATMGEIGLNPYQMAYTVGSDEYTDQVVSIENEIVNASNVAVAVNVASLLAEVPTDSGVVFATAALKGTETTKSVYMYMEMIADGGSYAESYTKADNQLLLGTKTVSKNNMVVLNKDGSDSGTTAKFKFNGKVATNPAKAWAATDKFTVKVKFTFTPQVVTATPAP